MELSKSVVLEDELWIAEEYLCDGLRRMRDEFQGSTYTYHHTLLSLSQGFERLLKVTLSFKYFEETRMFPTEKEFKKQNGHDLIKLWNKFEQHIMESQDDNANFIRKDFDILAKQTNFVNFLTLLSSFAKGARYHNLDIVSGSINEGVLSPHANMSRDYNDFFDTIPDWHIKLKYESPRDSIVIEESERQNFTRVVREYILLSLRIVARSLYWGVFGAEAKQLTAGKFSKILLLNENEIIRNLKLDFC